MVTSVYFFVCPPGPPENNAYLHTIVALVEGLQELGIATFANKNYWQTENGYLLPASDKNFRDCDVVFIDAALYDMGFAHLLPDDVFSKNRHYKLVYNDNSDGFITNGYRDEIKAVDIVLKSHYNKQHQYPNNFIPWQFGLTKRIINEVEPRSFTERNKTFLNNFRVSHPLRSLAQKKIAPFFRSILTEDTSVDSFGDTKQMNALDYSYWCQTGRRHYPKYYQRLSNSYACFCFGGNPQKFFYSQSNIFFKLLYKINWRLPIFDFNSIYQYDSWRFWESLVAGCCTLHIDFEKYGIVLPVMPINKKHYLGFDLVNIHKTTRLIKQNPDMLATIGNNGREWVLEHYSPVKTAQRFIDLF